MAERDHDREPRWSNTGDWMDRPDENREGDRSMARNYDRDDQRRYARKGQDLGDQLRQLRGQEPDWDNREGRDMRGDRGDREDLRNRVQRYEARRQEGRGRMGPSQGTWERGAPERGAQERGYSRGQFYDRGQRAGRDRGEGDPNRGYNIDYSGNFGREDNDQEVGRGGDVYRGFEMPERDQRMRRQDAGRQDAGRQDYRSGQSTGRGSAWESGSREERERYRGYGTDIARDLRERERGGRDRQNQPGRDWGWSGRQDQDRDYRTYNRGRDLNLEGMQDADMDWDPNREHGFERGMRRGFDVQPRRRSSQAPMTDWDFNRREDNLNRERGASATRGWQDRGMPSERGDRNRGMRDDRPMQRYQDPGNTNMYGPGYVDRGPVSDRDWSGDFDRDQIDFDYEIEEGYRTGMDRDWQASDEDLSGNFWGARERDRLNRQAGREGIERDRQPDQGGFVSGRNTNRDRGDFTGARDFGDDRDFDMDPGFAYEFGTDFDFMRDTDRETSRRDYFEQRSQDTGMGQQMRDRERGGRGRERERGSQSGRGEGTGSVASYSNFWGAGPHTGKGPSGYQRSDERIMEDVCERLTQHGQIDSRKIEIQVQDGQVTLTGEVQRRSEKHLAEDVADDVMGVKEVQNRIRVAGK